MDAKAVKMTCTTIENDGLDGLRRLNTKNGDANTREELQRYRLEAHLVSIRSHLLQHDLYFREEDATIDIPFPYTQSQ